MSEFSRFGGVGPTLLVEPGYTYRIPQKPSILLFLWFVSLLAQYR